MKSKIIKLSLAGTPYIGIHIKLLNKNLALVSNSLSQKDLSQLKKEDFKIIKCGAPIVNPYILETDKKNFFILSKRAPESLISTLKDLGFEIETIESKRNLLGNLFVIGKKGILYSKYKDKLAISELEKIFPEKEFKQLSLQDYPIIGGLFKIYNNKALISQYIPESKYSFIKEFLGLDSIKEGSVNMGGAFVKYGIEINEDGSVLIIGEKTTGFEILAIEEIFKD